MGWFGGNILQLLVDSYQIESQNTIIAAVSKHISILTVQKISIIHLNPECPLNPFENYV